MVRVLITGDCVTAKTLRGYLARHDFHLTNHAPDFVVHIEEQAGAVRPLIAAMPGELEQAILRHLRKQTVTPIEIHNADSAGASRAVRIVVPPHEGERRAVEMSVFRALLEVSGQQAKLPWWKALYPRKTK
jgi:hypothetical protein